MLDEKTGKPLEVHDFTLMAMDIGYENLKGQFVFQELDHKTFIENLYRQLTSKPVAPGRKTFRLAMLLRIDSHSQLERLP